MELYLHSPNTPSLRGAQLKKHRENYLFFYLWWLTLLLCLVLKTGYTKIPTLRNVHLYL
jgi:hypothetical protein